MGVLDISDMPISCIIVEVGDTIVYASEKLSAMLKEVVPIGFNEIYWSVLVVLFTPKEISSLVSWWLPNYVS